ncbi:MAG: putative toxin-antitoxin system toxin component, PIN family [Oscillospiraceae bacterium]|nr:putative toxin-antitoxin system toxin component, PIN family [Oscillospiraceae bacterium]
MRTVFVDTNVILDVLLQNDGFWKDSLKIFQLAELKQIRACVSASSMTDIFYVAKKKLTVQTARKAIEKMLGLFEVIGVNGDDLRGALTLPIEDMEDSLQAWCAKKAKADTLITRDTDGFTGIDIPVITPAKFTI